MEYNRPRVCANVELVLHHPTTVSHMCIIKAWKQL